MLLGGLLVWSLATMVTPLASVDEIYSFVVLVSRCDGFRRRVALRVEQRGLAVGAVSSRNCSFVWVGSKWIDDWFVSRAVVDVEVWNSWSFLRVWCDWRRGRPLEQRRRVTKRGTKGRKEELRVSKTAGRLIIFVAVAVKVVVVVVGKK